MSMYCEKHGYYSTTDGHCPQCFDRSGSEVNVEAVVSCDKCKKYKKALEVAVSWNDKYLDEVKDDKKYKLMMEDKGIDEKYKQTIILIRDLLSN